MTNENTKENPQETDNKSYLLYCYNCPHYDFEGEDAMGVSKCQQAERYVSRWDTCYLKKKI